MDRIDLPRLMITAPGSGSGKTMITCGILKNLQEKGNIVSFKCGPDYIDPMFHKAVLSIPSRNLDTFFTDENTTRYLMARAALQHEADMAVIEGVMGYYDGLAGTSLTGSSHDLALKTGTPAILIVNCKGMSLSAAALIKGFLEMEEKAMIRGVILNRVSAMMYPRLKKSIEERLDIKVLGFIPETKAMNLPGRHLGLMMPEELDDLQKQITDFANEIRETLDFDGLIEIAREAEPLNYEMPEIVKAYGQEKLRIGIARDEAFCFYYEDNLALLRELGAELADFSPLHDEKLPDNLSGIYMGGGYPELYGAALSDNKAMILAIRQAAEGGMPLLAECGAYMYLHEEMEDAEGRIWPVAGLIKGRAFKTPKLVRFGYTQLTARKDSILGTAGTMLPAHEFHYWDTTDQGDVFHASKPLMKRAWDCCYQNDKGNILAGFPHFYFYGNTDCAFAFIEKCRAYMVE